MKVLKKLASGRGTEIIKVSPGKVEISVSPTATSTGLVEGGVTAGKEVVACTWPTNIWWLPLLVQLVTCAAFIAWAKANRKTHLWSVLVGIMIVSQLAHWLIFSCTCTVARLCSLYWLFNLAITGISLYSLNRKES